MSTCSVSGLPIIENPLWKADHTQEGYRTMFNLIGPDIIHGEIVADSDINMDYIDIDIFQKVISENNLAEKPIYMLFGLKHVKGISFTYKKNLINLFYNSGPTFKPLVIYNVDAEIRSIVDTFAAIAPEESRIVVAESYPEAMQMILDAKSGNPEPKTNESGEEQQYNAYVKEFLSTLARLSWLNLFEHPITLPESTSPFYPFFKGLEAFQQDLREKETLYQQELKNVAEECEKKIAEKTILLNAQKALKKKTESQLEGEKSSLIAKIDAKEKAMKHMSSIIAEKRSKIKLIQDLVEQTDIEPAIKQRITSYCGELVDYYDQSDNKAETEITLANSAFIANLQRKHSTLSKRDLRLCMLIKQNLSTLDIAHTIGITTRGVESMRYRLHKKLGLTKHESIKNYLLGIDDR